MKLVRPFETSSFLTKRTICHWRPFLPTESRAQGQSIVFKCQGWHSPLTVILFMIVSCFGYSRCNKIQIVYLSQSGSSLCAKALSNSCSYLPQDLHTAGANAMYIELNSSRWAFFSPRNFTLRLPHIFFVVLSQRYTTAYWFLYYLAGTGECYSCLLDSEPEVNKNILESSRKG